MANHTHHEKNEKTLGAYFLGAAICLMLTLAAFALVEYQLLDTKLTYISLGILAIAQLFAQSICFLGLNAGPEGRWNLLPFLFTSLVVVILVGGSMWVMYNLNYNMLITY